MNLSSATARHLCEEEFSFLPLRQQARVLDTYFNCGVDFIDRPERARPEGTSWLLLPPPTGDFASHTKAAQQAIVALKSARGSGFKCEINLKTSPSFCAPDRLQLSHETSLLFQRQWQSGYVPLDVDDPSRHMVTKDIGDFCYELPHRKAGAGLFATAIALLTHPNLLAEIDCQGLVCVGTCLRVKGNTFDWVPVFKEDSFGLRLVCMHKNEVATNYAALVAHQPGI